MFVTQVKEAFNEVEENIEEAKLMIDEQVKTEEETGQYKAMLKGFLGDSYFKYGLGQNGKKILTNN